MPGRGRGRGLTSVDYKGELRKPGELRASRSQDGDKHVTTSAAEQTKPGKS